MTIDPSGNSNPQPEKPNTFYLSLLAVVAVTAIASGFSFWLSGKEGVNERQLEFLFLSNETWHTGLLAIIGLLGGKR
jgi:hypothetical protein